MFSPYSSSGVANVGLNTMESKWPPSLCHLNAISTWPFPLYLLDCVSLSSCSQQSVQLSYTQSSFISWHPFWTHTSHLLQLIHFLFCLPVLSWNICRFFLSSLKVVAKLKVEHFLYNKKLIGRPLNTEALVFESLWDLASDEKFVQIFNFSEL